MEIKIITISLLLLFQYGLCLDVNNCTNTSLTQLLFAANPTMKFYLFTQGNFFIEEQIFVDNGESIINSRFNPELPVKILVHGWTNYLMSCFNACIKDAYLQKGYFNIIIVDWSNWSQNINYLALVPYIFNILGPLLANFINYLTIYGNIPYDNIYLIGHSLGAHMCGSAGQNIYPNQVNTIVGLDPAGPGFQGVPINNRLDKTDAKYVEQISTDMGEAGYIGILGHASFYPNYGHLQPSCPLLIDIGCSHSMSYWYFAESINTQIGFCSQLCSFYTAILLGIGCRPLKCPGGQKILMGGEPLIPKTGTYYLETNNNKNFAICIC